jgi:hypothetical protein
MADKPANLNEVTLRQMIEMMDSYPDDTVFRWFTVDANKTVCVTMGQVRRELETHSTPHWPPHFFVPALDGESCKICICDREIGDVIHEPEPVNPR